MPAFEPASHRRPRRQALLPARPPTKIGWPGIRAGPSV